MLLPLARLEAYPSSENSISLLPPLGPNSTSSDIYMASSAKGSAEGQRGRRACGTWRKGQRTGGDKGKELVSGSSETSVPRSCGQVTCPRLPLSPGIP